MSKMSCCMTYEDILQILLHMHIHIHMYVVDRCACMYVWKCLFTKTFTIKTNTNRLLQTHALIDNHKAKRERVMNIETVPLNRPLAQTEWLDGRSVCIECVCFQHNTFSTSLSLSLSLPPCSSSFCYVRMHFQQTEWRWSDNF